MYMRIIKGNGNDTPKKAHAQDNNNNNNKSTLADYPTRLNYTHSREHIYMYMCVHTHNKRQWKQHPEKGTHARQQQQINVGRLSHEARLYLKHINIYIYK